MRFYRFSGTLFTIFLFLSKGGMFLLLYKVFFADSE